MLSRKLEYAEIISKHYQEVAASAHNEMVWAKVYYKHRFDIYTELRTTNAQKRSKEASDIAMRWLNVCIELKKDWIEEEEK